MKENRNRFWIEVASGQLFFQPAQLIQLMKVLENKVLLLGLRRYQDNILRIYYESVFEIQSQTFTGLK